MIRIFDLLFALAALLLLAPVLVAVSLVVALTSPGGVFFRGTRVGIGGSDFEIIKFRSMIPDAEGQGKWNVGMGDPRLTPVGRFLRASKLDELPQFFNVVRGDMSLVGPRPELRFYVDMYTEREGRILTVRPGITDWASLVNYSQYQKFSEVLDPDEYYLSNIRPLKLHLQLFSIEEPPLRNYFAVLFWTFVNLFSRSITLPKRVQSSIAEYSRFNESFGGPMNEQ